MKPAVVVAAYNRPHSLERLLASLAQAHYPAGVRLVISIDRDEDNQDVYEVAGKFAWMHGEKEVIYHDEHLGLIGNIFFCGGLSEPYGAVVLLEDDLVVSPAYYDYAVQALDFYGRDPRIAGISLNALRFNGYTHQPFIPYLDDSDVFFAQVAWFQGQVYSQMQWSAFSAWREAEPAPFEAGDQLHEIFSAFPATDWFPLKMKYLVETDRTYVFPRQSLTTHFGEPGTHFSHSTAFFQVPLQKFRRRFRLHQLDEAIAVYDSFMEIRPERLNRLTDALAGYQYDVDLYNTKSLSRLKADYILTTKRCHQPIFSFGKVMRPLEENVVSAVPGHEIVFCRKEELAGGWLARLMGQKSNDDYFRRGRRTGRKQRFLFWIVELLQKLRLD